MEVKGKIIEEYGYLAHSEGEFQLWNNLMCNIKKEFNIPLHEAAELAYHISLNLK